MVYHKPAEKIKQDTENIKTLIKKRKHIYLSGIYINKNSELIVICPKHNAEKPIKTTFGNYKRAKTGLPCCGSSQKREKLKNHVFNLQTLLKMKASARQRPHRGEKPRKWRKTNQYLSWKRKVMQRFHFQCAISGMHAYSRCKRKFLVVHHLEGVNKSPNLTYHPLNGIFILSELHDDFHLRYGYHMSTIELFLHYLSYIFISLMYFCSFICLFDVYTFLLLHNVPPRDRNLCVPYTPKQKKQKVSMPTSSQASLERLEGSETRVYDPARIMKLHERLERMQKQLLKASNNYDK